jgi:hypothetical protein
MMKRLLALSLVLVCFALPAVANIPLSERLAVLRVYLDEHPERKHHELETYYRAWYESDLAEVRNVLRAPVFLPHLARLEKVANARFEAHRMTYTNLGLVYLVFAALLSGDLLSQNEHLEAALGILEGPEVEVDVQRLERYRGGGATCVFSMLRLCVDRQRILPFVSIDGHATHREINESFGLGCPVLGVPLFPSGIDRSGKYRSLTFFDHDCQHVYFAGDQGALGRKYQIYRIVNSMVFEIQDKTRQFKADYFLAELGHERGFEHPYKVLLTPRNFDKMCDAICDDFVEKATLLGQPMRLDANWENVRALLPEGTSKEQYYCNE